MTGTATPKRTLCSRCRLSFAIERPRKPTAERLLCPECRRPFWAVGGYYDTHGFMQSARVGMTPEQYLRWMEGR